MKDEHKEEGRKTNYICCALFCGVKEGEDACGGWKAVRMVKMQRIPLFS